MGISDWQIKIESVVSILFIIVAFASFVLTVSFYIGHKRDAKRKSQAKDLSENSDSGKYFKKTKL